MRSVKLAFMLFILLPFTVTTHGQPTINVNQGSIDRSADQSAAIGGTFRFLNDQADISGTIIASLGDGIFTDCAFFNHLCLPGETVRIYDTFTGRNCFRATGPVTVNGTTYQQVFYRGTITIDGGTIRIPYYFAKRKMFKITVKSRITGGIAAYPNTSFITPTFFVNTALEGTTTLYFAGDGFTRNDIYKVVHNFPPPTLPE